MLRAGLPTVEEEPVAWAEGRGAAFPQVHAGVDRGGAAPRLRVSRRRG